MPAIKCKPGCGCGRHRKIRPEARGRKLSEEHRKKIGAAQKGRKLSDEHKANQSKGQIERYKKARAQAVAEPDHKRCTKCKKMMRVPEDYVMKERTLASGETKKYAAGECKFCGRKRAAAWREKKKAEGVLAELDRKYKRNYINKDPERYRRMQRESSAASRRKKGIPEKGGWLKYRDTPRQDTLPLEPLSKFMREFFSQPTAPSLQEAASAIGVDESRLRRLMAMAESNGTPIVNVTSDMADRILLGIDRQEMLPILYSE